MLNKVKPYGMDLHTGMAFIAGCGKQILSREVPEGFVLAAIKLG